MRAEGLADPDNFFDNILAAGGSLLCMANVQRGQSVTSPEELATISCPVMCLTGDQDFTGGDNAKLASYIPRGKVVYIEGHDHSSAVATPEFSVELLSFLGKQMPPSVPARL
jgi:pimeloyl-ACP methyl ester carboxylesterase